MMFEPRRLHPIAALLTFLQRLKELVVPVIFLVVIGGRGEEERIFFHIQTFGLVIFLLLMVIMGILHWYRYTYRIENDELRIEYGVFIRKKRYIPFERIQTVHVTAGVIHRLFRIVKLQVETAGGGGEAEATLTAITEAEASRLQEMFKKSTPEQETVDAPEIKKETNRFRITPEELLLTASTSGGIGIVLSGLIAFITQVDTFIPYEKIVDNVQFVYRLNTLIFVAIFAVILLFIAWVIGIVIVALKYANFTVVRREDELVVTRGLIEKQQLTLPLSRIQAIRIVENPLRQVLGYATVYIESAGGAAQEGEGFSTILFPLVKKKRIDSLLLKFLPDYQTSANFYRVPKRACIRYLFRSTFPVLIVTVIITFILEGVGYWSLLLVPVAAYLGYQRYRDAGWNEYGDRQIAMRFRLFSRVTVLLKRRRIQALEEQSTYFQRRKGLASLQASIKSSITGKSFKVIDLSKEEIEAAMNWYIKK